MVSSLRARMCFWLTSKIGLDMGQRWDRVSQPPRQKHWCKYGLGRKVNSPLRELATAIKPYIYLCLPNLSSDRSSRLPNSSRKRFKECFFLIPIFLGSISYVWQWVSLWYFHVCIIYFDHIHHYLPLSSPNSIVPLLFPTRSLILLCPFLVCVTQWVQGYLEERGWALVHRSLYTLPVDTTEDVVFLSPSTIICLWILRKGVLKCFSESQYKQCQPRLSKSKQ